MALVVLSEATYEVAGSLPPPILIDTEGGIDLLVSGKKSNPSVPNLSPDNCILMALRASSGISTADSGILEVGCGLGLFCLGLGCAPPGGGMVTALAGGSITPGLLTPLEVELRPLLLLLLRLLHMLLDTVFCRPARRSRHKHYKLLLWVLF